MTTSTGLIAGLRAPAAADRTASPDIGPDRAPRTPEEAARQFEQILLKQFVQVMTDGLFRSESGGGVAAAGADLQRDILTDELSRFLAEEGTLGLSDHLLKRMNPSIEAPAEPDAVQPK